MLLCFDLRNALYARIAVKSCVKTQNLCHPIFFHDRKVKRISGRHPRIGHYDFFRSLCRLPMNGKDCIHDTQNRFKSRLDGITSIDGRIAMQYFLKHFDIRNEALPASNQLFQQALCVCFVGVRRPNQVHRNIRVHEDHECGSQP